MRRLVSSATPGWPLMARLAVATETPTALATSRMPTGLPGASLSVVIGPPAGGMRDGPPVITLHDSPRHGKSARRARVRAAGPGPPRLAHRTHSTALTPPHSLHSAAGRPRGVTFRKIFRILNL